MKRLRILMFLVTVALHAIAAEAQDTAAAQRQRNHPVRALLIAAYPDDEYEMAGTFYRIANTGLEEAG